MMTTPRKFKSGWYITTKGNPVSFKSFALVSLVLDVTFIISEYKSFLKYSFFTNEDHIFSLFHSKSLYLELSLLMCNIWLKTKYKKCKYWWRLVALTCESVKTFPSCNPTFRSKNQKNFILTL